MDRRGFLAASTATLLGGCTFARDSPATPTVTPVPVGTGNDPTATPADQEAPTLGEQVLRDRRVVDFETAPLTVALYGERTIDGRVNATYGISAPATPEHPAVVHALVRNANDFSETFALRRLPGFWDPSSATSEDDDSRIYLAPTSNHALVETAPAVERDVDGRWRLAGNAGREWLPERVTLSPDEAVLGEYYLVGSEDTSVDPVSVGEYRFLYRGEGVTVAVWRTDAPGPEGTSRYEGVEVPDLPVGSETAWSHEVGSASAVYLAPGSETATAPARVEYAFVNHSHERIGGNPYRWGLYKLVDGTWFKVAPWGVPVPLTFLPPGDTAGSALGLYHGPAVECDDGRDVGHLGGGRYAYHVGFGRGAETHAALLDLEAPPVRPSPAPDVTTTRDGGTITVTMPAWHAEGDPPRAELVVTRADGGADRRLIPEQLFRRQMAGYRNTLPLFDGSVDRVRLRTDRHVVIESVDSESLERTVRYRGDTFHLVGEDPYHS